MNGGVTFRAGEWVEVRSKEEILSTLDKRGQREGLPFMPEMLRYCGGRFQVFKRAHKTCDPASGLQARRMPNAVHLAGVRCDGGAHGGCQAGCLMFWKDEWLKRVDDGNGTPRARASVAAPAAGSTEASSCTEADLMASACADGSAGQGEETRYVCQSTRLAAATVPLPWWDLRQYVEDVRSGNVRASEMVAGFLFFVYHTLAEAGLGFGAVMRWIYDVFQKTRGGSPYPVRRGTAARHLRTPSGQRLDLQTGELVKVRSYPEILKTLDRTSRNRGMYFDAEQVPFCNGTFRVLCRVERIIDEKTGRMMQLRNEAFILDNVVCEARYAKCRRFCPRSIYPYWRPIWLDRVRKANEATTPGV